MFGQTRPTEFDLRFWLFGIPVRVHPIFWLTAAFIGWRGEMWDLTLVNMLCVFASILVHELGHALMTRYFGWQPEIVLEMFGGYATTTRHSTARDIAVLIAGPAAGFLLYGLIWVGNLYLREVNYYGSIHLVAAVSFLLWANLAWNVLNLLPIFPLDGGQILRNVLEYSSPRSGLKYTIMCSIAVSGGIALLSFAASQGRFEMFNLGVNLRFLAIMMAIFCFQNIQIYQGLIRGYW